MSDTAKTLATPPSITIGSETYYVSPFTPADFGLLHEYCRDLALADVQSPLQALAKEYANLPKDFAAAAMREAVAQSAGAKTPEPTREAIAAKSISLDGVRFSFWLSARKLHPEFTLDKAKEIITADNSTEIMMKQLEAEGQKKSDDVDPKTNGQGGS